jgi:hypothetical protein
MKKMFKLLLCAAIVAAGFTACSEEVTPIDPINPEGTDGPVAKSESTYASFKLSVADALSTRSVDNGGGEITPVAISEYRVLIFRGDNSLEVDTFMSVTGNDISNATLTIPLISGAKKIFFMVNGGTDVANLTTPAKGTAFNSYPQFNLLQDLSTGGNPPTAFNTAHIGAIYGASGAKFLYTSSVLSATKTLDPGISAAQSQDPALPHNNYIELSVDRVVAKVAVRKTVPSLPTTTVATTGIITKDSTGRIEPTSVKYRLWNINKAVYPFQNYNASNVLVTPYGDQTSGFAANYLRAQGTGSGNAYIDIATRAVGATTPATKDEYRYVTENVPVTPYGGNTTYAEVEAIYLPTVGKYVSTTIGYNEATTTFEPIKATLDLTPASDLYKYLGEGTLGLEVGTVLGGPSALALAKKVVFHLLNPTTPPKPTLGDGAYTAIDDAQVATYFEKYTGGKSYYRLNFGEQEGGAGTDINFGVRRNYNYDAVISGFLGIGASTPEGLLDENVILQGKTNITVHIIIRDWNGKEIEIDI